MRRLISILAATVLAAALAPAVIAADPETEGTWALYPRQTYTDDTVTATSTSYRTEVRGAINPDGSSNWPSKRGVIAVQFDLLAAASVTTTTTRTYDPPVWESVLPDTPYTILRFDPADTLTFADITNLSANYLFTEGDCFGGSLRWDIYVTHDGVEKLIHVYYGTPNGPDQTCSGAASGSGANLITTGVSADRFEVQGGWDTAGAVYRTYADALAYTNSGTDEVLAVQLTLDSGWHANQRADISNITVNDNTWVPKTTETLSSTTITGDFAPTCDLPAAELRWAKNNSSASGAINEALSIQPKDSNGVYRQVDCKYIYNLDVSSLAGAGTYTVWVRIGGELVDDPASFQLR
jgi:hypothetical protein